MNKQRILSEKGQSLVIVALGLVAFVAMLALVIDGANAYAAKRQAQNAADSGALAGASAMCKYHSEEIGETTAISYTLSNGADEYLVNANLTSATVIVTATVTRETFFAGVIGHPFVSPVAEAEAACQTPSESVLPVAWSCRSPSIGGEILPGNDCAEKILPPGHDPYDLEYTYIMMDSVKVANDKKGGKCNPDQEDPLAKDYCYEPQGDVECYVPEPPSCSMPPGQPENKIDCDLNDDCIDELMAGGARAWLDLDGHGGGASDLKDWITGKEIPPITDPHTWLSSANGTATSIFRDVGKNLVGTTVLVPVFNNYCKHFPDIWSPQADPETTDNCTYTDRDNLDLAGSNSNYHIISYAAFHITCVQTGKNQVYAETDYNFLDGKGKDCNGHAAAVNNIYCPDPTDKKTCVGSIDENDKTIEGYFLEFYTGGYPGSSEWFDTGTFTVVLIK
jgi:hypothetical protein